MAKIAIFVEGYTEEEFVLALVKALVGDAGVVVEIKRQSGGVLSLVSVSSVGGATDVRVLLVNCCGEQAVLSQIRDQYNSLSGAGYQLILGLRDTYPEPPASSGGMQAAARALLPTGHVPVFLHFAEREVEAWFLQEATHYAKIDPGLTPPVIAGLGFDPFSVDSNAEMVLEPARHLDSIYRLAGKRYTKNRKHRSRTLGALSLEEIYFNVRGRLPSLNQFLSNVEQGLFPG